MLAVGSFIFGHDGLLGLASKLFGSLQKFLAAQRRNFESKRGIGYGPPRLPAFVTVNGVAKELRISNSSPRRTTFLAMPHRHQ
jgi:hypothetical protein